MLLFCLHGDCAGFLTRADEGRVHTFSRKSMQKAGDASLREIPLIARFGNGRAHRCSNGIGGFVAPSDPFPNRAGEFPCAPNVALLSAARTICCFAPQANLFRCCPRLSGSEEEGASHGAPESLASACANIPRPYLRLLHPTGVQGFTPGRVKGVMGVQRVEGGKSKSPLTLWP